MASDWSTFPVPTSQAIILHENLLTALYLTVYLNRLNLPGSVLTGRQFARIQTQIFPSVLKQKCLQPQTFLKQAFVVVDVVGNRSSRRRVARDPRKVPRHQRGLHELRVSPQSKGSLPLGSPRRRQHRPHPGPEMLSFRLPEAPHAAHQHGRPGKPTGGGA